jgi:DNA-binding beta-propeller fold protein YncE
MLFNWKRSALRSCMQSSASRHYWWSVVVVVGCAALALYYPTGALSEAKREASRREKPRAGWLYIVDSKGGSREAQVLLVDPSSGRVEKVFKTGMNPDIALSPDGTRLYLASSQLTADGAAYEELAVVDTSSGASLQTVSNAKRVIYNVIPPSTALAISPNGRWLYVMKYEVGPDLNTLYWVETFDTVDAKFLPLRANVSGCGWARLVPLDKDRQVQVVCEQSKDVRLLEINSRGAAVATVAQFAQTTIPSAPRVNFERHDGKIRTDLVAESFRSINGRNITVLRDGRILSIDVATNAVAEMASATLPGNAWIHSVARARDNTKLYLGLKVSRSAGLESATEGEIVSFNLSNLLQSSSNKTSQTFNYLYVSRDGRWLYAVNTWNANLLVIEAATLQEVRVLTDLGETPSLVVESP